VFINSCIRMPGSGRLSGSMKCIRVSVATKSRDHVSE
jgi:hypothetical protein